MRRGSRVYRQLVSAVLLWTCVITLAGCDQGFGLAPVTQDADPESCPAQGYAAIPGGSTLYRIGLEPHDWLYANEDCRKDSETGVTHLAVFDGIVELDAVRDAVSAAMPGQLTWRASVGYGRDRMSDPTAFYAVTGEPIPLDSTLWTLGEPNNGRGLYDEPVTHIGFEYRLTDSPVPGDPSLYVCECDRVPAIASFNFQ